MSNLTRALRGPMTWQAYGRHDGGTTIIVSCSHGHRSEVRHNVLPDGRLEAPPGQSPSMHCGHCNELLPLFLDGWDNGAHVYEPEPLPPLSTCAGCGAQSHFVAGWGLIGGIAGLACADCFQRKLCGDAS